VAVESSAGAIGFRFRIDMQNNSRHLAPVGSHGVRIEHPTVSDGVFFIARGQHVALGRDYSRSDITHGHSCGAACGTQLRDGVSPSLSEFVVHGTYHRECFGPHIANFD
jgi:hypothetical protein